MNFPISNGYLAIALLVITPSSAAEPAAAIPAPAAAKFEETNEAVVAKLQAIRPSGKPLSANDAKLARAIAMDGLWLLIPSQPASFKAVSEKVRLLSEAEVIVQNALAAKLAEIAGDTELPGKLDDKAQAALDRAKKADAGSRDRNYLLTIAVAGHGRFQKTMENVRANAADPALRELAGVMLPIIGSHLRAARSGPAIP